MPVAASLDDKYSRLTGSIYLNGIQALVRLLICQGRRDADAGLNTAGFVSGYRGSPLGGLDRELSKSRSFLDDYRVHFQPGVNEELAATAVWGSQQVNLFDGARYDGVFGMWYGKGPGADRSSDAFKHANAAGSSRHGGVLAIVGDDHGCKSSTMPHQSEHLFMDARMPTLNPAGIQDLLDLGIVGWSLSRFSGCWVGLKGTSDLFDSSAMVDGDYRRIDVRVPTGVDQPEDGLNIRWPDSPLDQDRRLQRYKLYAALEFSRVNRFDRVVIDSPRPRLGIATAGKSYLDVMQALTDIGIDAARAADLGIRVYKVAMTWPLEPAGIRAFAEGLEEILVVEERRAIIENQIREQLVVMAAVTRPRIVGKFDFQRERLVPSTGELSPAMIGRVILERLSTCAGGVDADWLQHARAGVADDPGVPEVDVTRPPHFCSGCPHNSSTRVPDGSRAMAGIGCHYMVMWMDRQTETFTQMGGEGATWIGQAPFTETRHVFQNIGDGTYFHSGSLAIRAAVAANVNITYKLLYNDAVAMTGGQSLDGDLSIDRLTQQLLGEGVRRIALVSDEPAQYPRRLARVPDISIHDRHELDAVQRQLRETDGVTALIYDQTCAAELRRRRKRGIAEDRPTRVFINPLVCEGCGDCNVASNCLSVLPLETEFGRKRTINQDACNKDYSCVNGFCPSFVTVSGGELRQRYAGSDAFGEMPEPEVVERACNILIAGVGGTGIVTTSALIGMAASLENKPVSALDQTGLAQKFGTVVSHVRIGSPPATEQPPRIPEHACNVLLACDLVAACSEDVLRTTSSDRTRAVVNTDVDMPSAFLLDPDYTPPIASMSAMIEASCVDAGAAFLPATQLVREGLGDSILTNVFMLGYAWQKGLIPLQRESILTAIELNGVQVERNQAAFELGRRRTAWLPSDSKSSADTGESSSPASIDEMVERRVEFLIGYQDAKYAARYRSAIDAARKATVSVGDCGEQFVEVVARIYFRLLAYKDEYEVARLFAETEFLAEVRDSIEGDFDVRFHLSPPLIARKDKHTGRPAKYAFGAWMLPVFRVLARLRALRGSWFDLFGYTKERREERRLIEDYEATIAELLPRLGEHNIGSAMALAAWPEAIRGFGPVKMKAIAAARRRREDLIESFRSG
ncbi:MAG: indolepyruvate ferredoxin oxidoreductase family protein [Gammaproteobacteria bacterium]